MADQTIDYAALAKQSGAISSTPPPAKPQQGSIDYAALAKESGAISSTPPTTNLIDQPGNQFLYTTKEGIPVYGAGPKPISIPLYNYPIDPATGQRTQQRQQIGPPQGLEKPLTTGEKALTAPLAYERAGMEQLGQGLEGITHPQGGEQMAGAASDIIRGGLQTATPFMLPEMVAHPLAAATGLATFGTAQAGVEALTKKLGLPEGYSRLAGDLLGMYGGAKVHNWLADMAKLPDKRIANDIYRRLEMAVESLKDPSLNPNERAAAKATVDSLIGALRQEEGFQAFPKLFPNPNLAERSAYDYMRQQVGVTPSAGAATGNPLVRGAQWLTGVFPAGAMMDQSAKKQNIEAMRGHAAQLVSKHLPEEGPSRAFYADFEDRVNSSAPQNVPLSIDRDGSQ